MAEASAPASSANLGPGFDAIGLALELRCRVVVEPAEKWSVTHHGPERFESPDPSADAVLTAAERVAGVGSPMKIDVYNEVPLSRGLGSSAAAFAAGVMATRRALGDDPTQDDVFPIVAELEGHPDNAAAAVYGGLVAVVGNVVMPLELHSSIVALVAVPGFELSTASARAVLPAELPFPAAVRSVGRVVALIEGLRTGDPAALAAAGGDELHEAHRDHLNPRVPKIIEAARGAGALHACWSGAGPSVLALVTREECDPVTEALEGALDEDGRVIKPTLATDGVW